MQNTNINFVFEETLVRVVIIDGAPWFVAKDVAKVLSIPWNGNTTLDKIKLQWRGVWRFHTPPGPNGDGGGEQELLIISEPGVYKLAFRSNKPEAERFTDWIAAEVLPSIRRTGSYRVDDGPAAAAPAPAAGLCLPDVALRVQMVRAVTAMRQYGAALQLWGDLGLPRLSVGAPIPTADAEDYRGDMGYKALMRILDAKHRGRSVSDLLSAALDGDALARGALLDIGVRIMEDEGGVAFANATAFMRALFKGYPKALRLIPGARVLGGRYYGATHSRGTLVPMACVEEFVAEPAEPKED